MITKLQEYHQSVKSQDLTIHFRIFEYIYE